MSDLAPGSRRRRFRDLDWLVVVILIPLWLFCVGMQLRSGLRPRLFPPVGVGWSDSAGYPLLKTIRPGVTPADTALRRGDRLIRLGVTDLRGMGPPGFYGHYLAEARPDEALAVVFERGGQRALTRMPSAVPMPLWPFLVVSIGFFLVGIFLSVRSVKTLSRVVPRSLVLVSIGCLCPITGGVDANQAGLALAAIVWAIQFPSCLVGLPVPPRPVGPTREWQRFAPWFVVIMGPIGVSSMAGFPFRRPAGIVLWHVALVLYLVVALVLVARIHRASDLVRRRQIRWVVFGFVAALTPPITASALVLFDLVLFAPSPALYPLLWASMASGVLIPISILIAIVRQNLFDVDRLLSATASYNLVLIGLLATGLVVAPWLGEWSSLRLGIDQRAGQLSVSLLLASAAIPAGRWLRPRVERMFFQERYALEQGVAELLRAIAHCGAERELMKCVGERLHQLLRPKSCLVYASAESATFDLAFCEAREDPPRIEAGSPLVATLASGARPLSLSASARRADGAVLGPFDRAALEALEAEVVVPIVRGRTLAAFVCLGPKRSGDVYTSTDLAHLASVAEACAAALGRFEREAAALLQPATFRREGDVWTIAYAGKEVRLTDLRGLQYLALLLREPGRELHASELARAGQGPGFVPARDDSLSEAFGLGNPGERLDAKARAAYKARLTELDAAQAEAEGRNDLGALEHAAAEREALLAELAAAARGPRGGSDAERARVTVTKGIKAALGRIELSHPELAAHLNATVHRGTFCAYVPDPRHPIEWEV